ncbi:hypothetical protein GQ457_06G001840 [Hibiscus cannabinus]
MVRIQSGSYTSLRYLLPPASISSPTKNMPTVKSSCWHEIPIKNPTAHQARRVGLFAARRESACCWRKGFVREA